MNYKLASLMVLSTITAGAHAQSSVTLYGIIATGIEYVSNEGGHSAVAMVSGANQNNRWGLRIVEDLGGGLKAVATLENGFSSTNGELGQGGRMFGRQAFVGLSSTQYGTLTAGRQYDVLFDYLDRIEPQALGPGLGTSVGSNDNVEGNFRYNNSIKYRSPNFFGVEFEALYAFSNKAGAFQQNRAFSTGINYAKGPVQFAVAYLDLDYPGAVLNASGAVTDDYSGAPFALFHSSPLNSQVGVRRQQVIATGGEYDFGRVQLAGMYSNVQYSYLDHTSLHLNNVDAIAVYDVTPALFVSAAYLYTNGVYGGIVASSHWNTAQAAIDYFLSKRTDVYLYADYIRASGPLAEAVTFLNAPSSSKNQTAVLAGIRHKF
ncbi:porin [Paraburkholderia pallida]|nr:porin [Paraburkholderia pallida]